MKRTIFTMSVALCLAFSSVLLSCDGIAQKINGGGQADSETEKEFVISGTLSLGGSIPSEIASGFYSKTFYTKTQAESEKARTAIPSIPNTIHYKVSAEATINGKKETREGVFYNNNDTNKTFTIKLSSGTWTIKAEGYSDSDKTEKILEGTSSSVTLDNAIPVKNNISIELAPIKSGNGNIYLNIQLDRNVKNKVKSIKMELSKDGSDSVLYTFGNKDTMNLEGQNLTTDTTYPDGIPAGSYRTKITFYSEKDYAGDIAYSTFEYLQVFQGLTTNTWQGSSLYIKTYANETTSFLLTEDILNDFERPLIVYVKADGNNANTGTYFDPFATIEKALEESKKQKKSGQTSTVRIVGKLTEHDIDISGFGNSSLVIEGYGENAEVNANNAGRVFNVSDSECVVTLRNLKITGGNAEKKETSGSWSSIIDGCGGGICFLGKKLTLENAEVTGNSAAENGGGIYIQGSGSTSTDSFTDSVISGNKAKSGGGIYLQAQYQKAEVLNLNGNTKIYGNYLESSGSSQNGELYGDGIYASPYSSLNLSGDVYFYNNPPTEKIGSRDRGDAIYLQGTPDTYSSSAAYLKVQGNVVIKNEIDGSKHINAVTLGKTENATNADVYYAYVSVSGELTPQNNKNVEGEKSAYTAKIYSIENDHSTSGAKTGFVVLGFFLKLGANLNKENYDKFVLIGKADQTSSAQEYIVDYKTNPNNPAVKKKSVN